VGTAGLRRGFGQEGLERIQEVPIHSERVAVSTPEHDADHGKANGCGGGRGVTFEGASQLAIATDPSEGPFDYPSFR